MSLGLDQLGPIGSLDAAVVRRAALTVAERVTAAEVRPVLVSLGVLEAPTATTAAPISRCGTYAGFSAHRRAKTTPCEPCRDAERTASREARRRRAVAAEPVQEWTVHRIGRSISHPWMATAPGCPLTRHATRECACRVFRAPEAAHAYVAESQGSER